MDNQQLSYVGPLAPIIGAIIGGLITLGITYFFVMKRKTLTFYVRPTEDLTSSLQRHHQQILFSVGGQPFFNLNRATVLVRNTGNVSIEKFNFDVEIPGNHEHYLADIADADVELRAAMSITPGQPLRTVDPVFHISVGTFLNAREAIRLAIFFDGDTENCKVRCRVAEVKAKVKGGEPLDWRDFFFRAEPRLLASVLLGLLAALTGIGTAFVEKILPAIRGVLGTH